MKFIAYYRVSTKQQGEDGNGIKAQRHAVRSFLDDGDELVTVFTEVESGGDDNRPVLKQAITMCKDKSATLLVAKLDRLSRNVSFLFDLKDELADAGVSFTVANNPEITGNALILGVMASMAQHERDLIKKRTSEGIEQSEKFKNDNWGNQEGIFAPGAREKAWATNRRKARTHPAWTRAYEFIARRVENKDMTYAEIAEALNAKNYKTRTGKKFHPTTVGRIYRKFKKLETEE